MKLWKNATQVFRRVKEDGIGQGATYLKRRTIAKLKGYPHIITFEAAAACNVRCSFCYIYKMPLVSERKFLPLATFQKVVEETEHFLQEISLHWRGEPLLNKELPDMVLFASEHGIRSNFSSNGQLLTEDLARAMVCNRLNCITICLDGMTQEVYGLHRCGGDMNRLIENINTLVHVRSTAHSRYPRVQLQMIVTKKNQHQIEEFRTAARKLGVDSAHLMSLFVDRTADDAFVRSIDDEFFVGSDIEGLSRYFVDEKGEPRLYGSDMQCPQDAKYPVVSADGRLVGCCYDIFLKHAFGNCEKDSFMSLWERPDYENFRRQCMMPRKLEICKNCIPGNREWAHTLF